MHVLLSIYCNTALNDKAEVVEYIHDLNRHTLIQLGGALGLHYHSQGKTTPSGIIYYIIHFCSACIQINTLVIYIV